LPPAKRACSSPLKTVMNQEDQQSARQIWIIGGGRFGSRALKFITGRFPSHQLVVVDPDPCSPAASHAEREGFPHIQLVREDGIAWLVKELSPATPVDWLIPALPVHLCALWLSGILQREGWCCRASEIPQQAIASLPNPLNLSPDCFAVSYANFLCPEDCPEPALFCTVTGEPRQQHLYEAIAGLDKHETLLVNDSRFHVCVVRSHQLGPGVGGLQAKDLWDLKNWATQYPDEPLLVGTACRCHGIISGLLCSRSN